MKPTISNAFTRSAISRRRALGHGKPVIASLTAAMQETDFGWALALTPMRAIDALPVWSQLGAASLCSTLVLNLQQNVWREHRQPLSAAVLATRLDIPLLDSFAPHNLVLADQPLLHLLGLVETTQLAAVRIEGPIEASDCAAITRAVQEGHSPLLAELRAVAAMSIAEDRSVTVHARRQAPLLELVAENLRHYLAAVLNRGVEHFAAPPVHQLERLLSISGRITIRPIETTINGSSIDVGISTSSEKTPGPANRSLLFDLPSNTWHDEP